MAEPFDIEKYRSIGLIRPRTQRANRKDSALSKDMAAYARLRADGQQPAQISGCAELEAKATMPIEIEMGRAFARKDKVHAAEGVRVSEEIGLRGPWDK